MISEKELNEIIDYQKQWFNPKKSEIKRELIIPKTKHIKIITGIRRSGKSTLLKHNLWGVKNSIFLNFEDSRLINFGDNDFPRLSNITKNIKNIFLDEIQNISHWEIFVRQLHTEGKNIFLTGSNSNLLSKELGTKLTGRHISLELFPFSYKEFLNFKKLKKGINSFKDYFSKGGFPEYLEDKESYILQQLLEDIIIKDVIVRYGLKDKKKLQKIASYLISNVGKQISLNQITKIFEIGSTTSTSNYVSYFEESYIIFLIPKFEYSLKKQEVNLKKVYSIDPGFIRKNSLSFSKDSGRILENIVFLQLRKHMKEIYYFKNKYECDFICNKEAIQVCFEMNRDNQEREINGLVDALRELKQKEGLILTFNQEDKFVIDGLKIIIKPVWKWLLE